MAKIVLINLIKIYTITCLSTPYIINENVNLSVALTAKPITKKNSKHNIINAKAIFIKKIKSNKHQIKT